MWDISDFKYLGMKRHVYLFFAKEPADKKDCWSAVLRGLDGRMLLIFSEGIQENGITSDSNLKIHSDNGSPLRSQPTVNLFKSKCVELDTSRPLKSNDNPYVESLFGTLKGPFDFKVDYWE